MAGDPYRVIHVLPLGMIGSNKNDSREGPEWMVVSPPKMLDGRS